jgi:hypothetical protein
MKMTKPPNAEDTRVESSPARHIGLPKKCTTAPGRLFAVSNIIVVFVVVLIEFVHILITVATAKVLFLICHVPKVGIVVNWLLWCNGEFGGSGHAGTCWYVLLRLINDFLCPPVVFVLVVAVEYARVDVRRGVNLGIIEQEQDGSENGFDAVKNIPTLARQLARLLVFSWLVKNGNAEIAVWVNVGVADILSQEFESRRLVWVIVRELHLGLEVGAMPDAVGVDNPETEFPAKDVRIVGLEDM